MAENVVQVTDETFEAEVLKAEGPVLVDFWAPWCGPCRMVGPIVEELANDNADKVKVCKCNTDETLKAAQKYLIRSIPTLMVFKNGEVAEQVVGARSKADLQELLNKHIG
ncbi:MAG: thioredoxin [Planctomycetota bacterium]